ncbi:putative restriction endonuclease [Devosia subaequoris]|uniref:Putative restriction endonuclease n=1 Tax=Devosia subaequoris TaxID=395930 RepID=A0A7W6ILV0_9HYPH|nr:hypothetical protein [Devosia subaequoris]MBB4052036.1 putative restriction endonuclease [Devosia subaequoris]MCP1210199.1 hypothetical protein [Devosia subaequoris]
MADRDRSVGFAEGIQRGFALDDAVSFRQLMLETYNRRCAVTGKSYAADEADEHLEVFLFQPLEHGGRMAPDNAVVVDTVVAGLLSKGHLLISDAYCAYTSHPEIVSEPVEASDAHGRNMVLPDNISLWPQRAMVGYHRSLFRAQ